MQQREKSDDRYDAAIRAKLGEGFRAQHNLMEPLAPRLLELLAQLDTSFHVRVTTEAKLYAEVDECVAAMVRANNRKSCGPEEAQEAGVAARRKTPPVSWTGSGSAHPAWLSRRAPRLGFR
jgi:hypothetical protein